MKSLTYAIMLLVSISFAAAIGSPFSILDVSSLQDLNIKINLTNKEEVFCVQGGNCSIHFLVVNTSTIQNTTVINQNSTNITTNFLTANDVTNLYGQIKFHDNVNMTLENITEIKALIFSDDEPILIGKTVSADSSSNLAIGDRAESYGDQAVSLGFLSTSSGTDATAIGSNTAATGNYAFALGAGAVANSDNSVAVGSNNFCYAEGCVSVGTNTIVNLHSIRSTAIGYSSTVDSYSRYSTAIGHNNAVVGSLIFPYLGSNHSVVIGSNSRLRGHRSMLLGVGTSLIANDTFLANYTDSRFPNNVTAKLFRGGWNGSGVYLKNETNINVGTINASSATIGDGTNGVTIEADGDLQLDGTAQYLVDTDDYAFAVDGYANYGLYFQLTGGGQYQFKDGSANTIMHLPSDQPQLTLTEFNTLFNLYRPIVNLKTFDGQFFSIEKYNAGEGVLRNNDATNGIISIFANNDNNDHIYFQTLGDIPRIDTDGSCDLNMSASGGNIYFEDVDIHLDLNYTMRSGNGSLWNCGVSDSGTPTCSNIG